MNPSEEVPASYVVVIDRAVFRRVQTADFDVIAAAMAAKHEYVTFRADGTTVRARIDGVSVGWAPERTSHS